MPTAAPVAVSDPKAAPRSLCAGSWVGSSPLGHAAAQGSSARGQHRRRVGALLVALDEGEAEVADPDAPLPVDEDVVRLEVAVHDAGGVGRGQALAGAAIDVEHLAPAALRAGQPAAQGLPGHELHRHEDLVAVRADVEDSDHVRMRQLGQRVGLAQDAAVAGGAGRVAHELERHLAVEAVVVGRVHHAHAAGADLVEQDVAVDGRAARQRPGRALLAAGRQIVRYVRHPSPGQAGPVPSTCLAATLAGFGWRRRAGLQSRPALPTAQ